MGDERVREPEPRIVTAAKEGDAAAFEELVHEYQAGVWQLVWHLVGDRETASDITQDTFLRAWRALPRFRGDAKFSTWLFRIARNGALDHLRRRTRERDVQRTEAQSPAVDDPSLRAVLSDVLGGLPSELREPFVLIEIFGFSYSEAGMILGTRTGTLKSRMHRARRVLMDRLADEEDAGEV